MRTLASTLVSTLLVAGSLAGPAAFAADPVNMTGFWKFNLSDNRNGYMTLAKQNDQGGPGTPSYTGQVYMDGWGTFKIYCIQVTSYHVPGNAFSINIGDPVSYQSLCFTVTGSGTMPGQVCGAGWQGTDHRIVQVLSQFTATRQ